MLDALGVLAKAATIIAEGEVFQLSKARRPRRPPQPTMTR